MFWVYIGVPLFWETTNSESGSQGPAKAFLEGSGDLVSSNAKMEATLFFRVYCLGSGGGLSYSIF